jgi:endonuclease/exonuclease/phosphatase family metal-dependent hydrolase
MSATSHHARQASVQRVPEDPAELRVLHWNIHSWRDAAGAPNIEAVTALIRQTRPDVVSLVEVNEPWGSPTALTEVADACGYAWIYGPALEYLREQSARGYGNALLTRVPVSAVQQWRVFSPSRLYDGSEQAEPRSVVAARVPFAGGTSGGTIWVGSTHFPASEASARKIAGNELRQFTSRLTSPWLICGDYNARPADCFADPASFQVSPARAQPTFPARHPRAAIDYCIASPGIFLRSEVLRTKGSDHLPLLTTARTTPFQTPAPRHFHLPWRR